MIDVKKFLLNISIFIVVIIVIFLGFFLGITKTPIEKYENSYQKAINLKYKHLKETKGPKVIIVGGSNCAFGIDENLITEKIGRPVVNMGLHAGLGTIFNTEIANANIEKGDIIVLAHEYDRLLNLDAFDVELLLSGAEDNIEIYQYLNSSQRESIIKFFPTYVLKKINDRNEKKSNGVYSIESFDRNGNLTYTRITCSLPNDITPNYGKVELQNYKDISSFAKYTSKFCEEVEGKGGEVVFTFPPIIEERFYATDEEIRNFEQKIDIEINATRISKIEDYIFPREYMYDTIYHCNDLGEKVRSERLANDILQYINRHKREGE